MGRICIQSRRGNYHGHGTQVDHRGRSVAGWEYDLFSPFNSSGVPICDDSLGGEAARVGLPYWLIYSSLRLTEDLAN